MSKPGYVYVASSWRCEMQPAVVTTLRAAGIDCYDFRNPPNNAGFGWEETDPEYQRGAQGATAASHYLTMLEHTRAHQGFASDMEHLIKADTCVLVLPCGRSAHLELGFAVGAGKRTAILLEDPLEPELMYKMVDFIAPTVLDLLWWLGVED